MWGLTVHIEDVQPSAADGRTSAAGQRPGRSALGAAGSSTRLAPMSEPACSENEHRSGQLVDHYRIVRLIGVGGTARVYEAVHDFTKKAVALKIMRHRLMERRDVLERFRHEAMALASIRHENVVAVENAGLTDDGRVFIAMELLRGSTLRDLLVQRGRLGHEETTSLLLAAASGVYAAHRAGVIHRDIKPENVFCTATGGIKILDLGTAKFAGEEAPGLQTAVGRIVGTVAYVAPERFNGEPGDVRSDIYALGLLAYECLAGHHALVPAGEWPSDAEMATRQVTYDPGAIPDLPPALWAVVSKAIRKVPSLRFQSMAELLAALQSATEHLRRTPSDASRQLVSGRGGGLTRPIVAGVLCGVIGAGAIHIARVTHARRFPTEGASTGSGSTLGSSRPTEAPSTVSSLATAGRQRIIAAASDTERASPGNAHAARLQGAAPARALTNVGEPVPARARAAPARRREPASSQTIEPVTTTRLQAGGRAASAQNTPNEEVLAPVQGGAKDDLPASGL